MYTGASVFAQPLQRPPSASRRPPSRTLPLARAVMEPAAAAPATPVAPAEAGGATPTAKGTMKASSQAAGSEMVTVQAKRILALSKGRVRVPLEDLGPALFNRQGMATDGRHCHELGERILKVEGFATFRYEAGFCHEPDPERPLAVAEHGNAMAARDPLLPWLPAKPLKGVFAKTHLVTFLQLLKGGRLPDLAHLAGIGGKVASSQDKGHANEDLHDVLSQGIFMHVFPWSAVRDHRDDILALMSADNFDHGQGLADSELRCVRGVRQALVALPVPPGMSQFAAVCDYIRRSSGQRWHQKDMEAFFAYAQTTPEEHLELLLEIWTFAGCESVLRVDSAFFLALSRLPAKLQWVRTALAVCQFMSDREKECIAIRGGYVANAVSKSQLSRLAATGRSEEQRASSQDSEAFIKEMMDRYYFAFLDGAPRPLLTKAVAGLLFRAGRSLANDRPMDRGTMETKLRNALASLDKLPPPLCPATEPKQPVGLEPREPPVTPVSTTDGEVQVPLTRLASEAGLRLDARVVKKLRGEDAEASSQVVGQVRGIGEDGVRVDWGAGAVVTELLDDLLLAPPKDKPAKVDMASSQVLEKPGVKWSPAGSDINQQMLLQMAQVSLYQAFLTSGAGVNDLHIVASEDAACPVLLYARRDFKPHSLNLLPFSMAWSQGDIIRPPNAVPLAMTVKPEGDAEETVPYWVRPKPVPKKLVLGTEEAVTIVPYFALALHPVAAAISAGAPSEPAVSEAASSQEPGAELQYEVVTYEVPPPMTKGGPRARPKVTLTVVRLTNPSPVAKGARLFVKDRSPSRLESLTST